MLLMNDSVSLSENISCESGLILKCRIFFYISIICFHICDVPSVVFGHATSTIALLTAILVSWSPKSLNKYWIDPYGFFLPVLMTLVTSCCTAGISSFYLSSHTFQH